MITIVLWGNCVFALNSISAINGGRDGFARSPAPFRPDKFESKRRSLWSGCVYVRTNRSTTPSSDFESLSSMLESRKKCDGASITRSRATKNAVHAAGLNAVRESTASQECEKRLPILGKKQRHPKTAPRNWGRLFLLTEQKAANER